MQYGEKLLEKVEIVKGQYSLAVDAYVQMVELFKASFEDNNKVLQALIEKSQTCHDSLFNAFEHIMKILTGEYDDALSGERRFSSLIKLAKTLDQISIGYRSGSMELRAEIDYSIIQKMDLNRIVTTKDARNKLTHHAVLREARHYLSLFDTLKRLILLVEPSFDGRLPDVDPGSERELFGRFYGYIEGFVADDTAYVLLMDPVWDIPDEHVRLLLSLPWDAVIDLDGRGVGCDGTVRSRVEKLVRDNEEETISIFALKADESAYSANLTSSKIPYLNFSDGDISLDIEIEKTEASLTRVWSTALPKDRHRAEENLKKKRTKTANLREFLKTYLSNKSRAIVVSLAEAFVTEGGAWQLIAEIAKKFDYAVKIALVQDTSEEIVKLPDGIDNSMYITLDCEQAAFFRRLYENKELLQTCISGIKERVSGDCYRFPLRDKQIGYIPRNDTIKDLEEYFELLHLDVGTEFSENDVEQFYRGHMADWSVLSKGSDTQIAPDLLKYLVQKLKSSFITDPEVSNTYYLKHELGAGGTTFGRRIAWDIHKDFPVAVLKRVDNRLLNRIEALYTALNNTPFLILADIAHGISSEDMEEFIRVMRVASRWPVTALIIQRIVPGERNNGKDVVTLPDLDKGVIDLIKTKCMEYAVRLYKTRAEMELHAEEFDDNVKDDKKLRVPMIINMYIMDKNFKTPEAYVRTIIHKEAVPESMLTVLKFVSLYSIYTDNFLPARFLASVYNENGNTINLGGLKSALGPLDRLFLIRYGDGRSAKVRKEIDGVRCIHPLFAEEILRYLMGETWKRNLAVESWHLVETAIPLLPNISITEMLSLLFARRNDNYLEEYEIIEKPTMSPLVNAVMTASMYSDGIELVKKVAERISAYIDENVARIKDDTATDFSHILNLSARLWAQCARYYRGVYTYDESQMDLYTDLSMKALDIDHSEAQKGFHDIYHMAGMCGYKKLKAHLESAPNDISDGNVVQIRRLFESTIDYFKKCIKLGDLDYGLPAVMQTYDLILKHIFNMLGFKDNGYRPEKLDTDKFLWVQENVIDEANLMIDDAEQYRLSDKSQAMFYKYANSFRETYLLGDNSVILQDLGNYIDRLNQDGLDHPHSLQQAYRQMVYFLLNKYHDPRTKTCDYLKLIKNRTDVERLKRYIEEALKSPALKSSLFYRTWFKLAKLEDVPFSDAMQRAIDWAGIVASQPKLGRKRDFGPYYYMYVISLLSNQPRENVAMHWKKLTENMDQATGDDDRILDYYAAGKKGFGCLVDRDWAPYGEIYANEMVSWVEGRIVHVSEDEVTGWINIPGLRELEKQQCSGEGQVFFKPRTAGKTINQVKDDVSLKFGFSLKRIRAVDNTLSGKPPRDQDRSGEILKVGTLAPNCVVFFPERVYCVRDTDRPALIIGKVNRERAALHISDIRQYGDAVLREYHGEREVLSRLAKLKSFAVIIKRADKQRGHELSLYDTKQKIADILK